MGTQNYVGAMQGMKSVRPRPSRRVPIVKSPGSVVSRVQKTVGSLGGKRGGLRRKMTAALIQSQRHSG